MVSFTKAMMMGRKHVTTQYFPFKYTTKAAFLQERAGKKLETRQIMLRENMHKLVLSKLQEDIVEKNQNFIDP